MELDIFLGKTYVTLIEREDGSLQAITSAGKVVADNVEIVSEWKKQHGGGGHHTVRYIRFMFQGRLHKGHYAPDYGTSCTVRPYSAPKKPEMTVQLPPVQIPELIMGTLVKYIYRGNKFEQTYSRAYQTEDGNLCFVFQEIKIIEHVRFATMLKIVDSKKGSQIVALSLKGKKKRRAA